MSRKEFIYLFLMREKKVLTHKKKLLNKKNIFISLKINHKKYLFYHLGASILRKIIIITYHY